MGPEQVPSDESAPRSTDESGPPSSAGRRSSRSRRSRSSPVARIGRTAGVVLLVGAVAGGAAGHRGRPPRQHDLPDGRRRRRHRGADRQPRQGAAIRFASAFRSSCRCCSCWFRSLQSIPMPLGLRAHLDPRGTELLRDNEFVAGRAWPLSLDPASTRAHIGRAAAALAVFLGAFHLAASRHRRRLVLLRGRGQRHRRGRRSGSAIASSASPSSTGWSPRRPGRC